MLKNRKIRNRNPNKKASKSFKSTFNFEKHGDTKIEPVTIPPTKPRQSFELTTLTNFSRKEPKFPSFEEAGLKQETVKPMPQPRTIQPDITKPKEENIVEKNSETKQPRVEDKIEIIQSVTPKPSLNIATKPDIDREVAKISEFKALPEPKTVTEQQHEHEKPKPTTVLDDDFDDDGDDLDKIKGDIMKVLSKLDQAEVE